MKKILIIEDNESNLYLIRYILEKSGYQVISTPNALTGIEIAINQKPDLVIMDVQLPDINGLEATRRIRENSLGKELKIVALTSYAMPRDKEKALNAGCDGYMEKPIDPKTFLNELLKFM